MKVRMKIGIVNKNFSIGGVQRVATEIAKSLSLNIGYEVDLIDFSGENFFFYKDFGRCKQVSNTAKRTFIEKISWHFKFSRYKIFNIQLHFTSTVKRQIKGLISILKKQKYDIIILCQGDMTALIPLLKKKLPQAKFIAWQHNDYEIYFKKYYVSYLDEYKQGLELADCVVCLTNIYEEKFKRHNYNTVCIHNPITIASGKKSKLDSNKIIFVGRLSIEHKGLDLLLEIVELSSEKWEWLLAGEGNGRAYLESEIKKRKLKSKITLTGALEKNALIKHFQSGAVYVSPSRWEGMSLVIIEAMSFGLPVVAFDIPGTRETLDDGRCGILIEKYDIKKFCEQIENLMSDKALRKHYQFASLERVKDFSLESITLQWKKLIELL